MDFCREHSEMKSLISRNIKDIQDLNQKDISINQRVDKMKNWVIAGMSSLVLQLIVFIGGLIIMISRTG